MTKSLKRPKSKTSAPYKPQTTYRPDAELRRKLDAVCEKTKRKIQGQLDFLVEQEYEKLFGK